MKAILAFLAGIACALTIKRHVPVRQFLGGYRCAGCGKPGDSFDDFGSPGYVSPLGKTYERGRTGGVTRDGVW